MKALFRFLTISGLFLSGLHALAQPGGGLGQLEVEVTEKYKAQVAEAVKIFDSPSFEDTTTSKLPVNYRITSEPIEVHSEPEPISPARISQVPVDELYNGMLRLGFGLYTTPLAEAYWNSGRSSGKSFGFWGRHFSTQTGVDQTIFTNNALNQNQLGGYYNRFYRNMKWETQVSGEWDKYSYYGVDALPEDIAEMADTLELDPQYNWFRQYSIKTGIKAEDADDLGLVDAVNLEYYNFTDVWNGQENFVKIGSEWILPTGDDDGNDLDLDFDITWFKLAFDSIATLDQSYLTFRARPSYTLVAGDLLFEFGLNVYGNDYTSDSTGGAFNFRFFPQINVSYPFVEDVLSVYGGVTGQLEHNTYRRLTRQNPYITPAFISRPTRTTDIYVGVEGIISATTSFNLRGGYMLQKDLLLYYRSPYYRDHFAYEDMLAPPSIGFGYDDAQTFYARGELSLNLNDNLQVDLFGELRNYNMDFLQEAFYRPSFTAGLSADYTLREKLKFGTELNFVGVRHAFPEEIDGTFIPDDIEPQLSPYLDVSFNFEYLYNSRLSAFINVTNLINQQYDMYLGYQAQSINFLMGFGYKF